MSERKRISVNPAPVKPERIATSAGRVINRIFKQPTSIVTLTFILLLVVVAIFAPVLAPADPTASNYANVLMPPSAEFLLGTDDMGQDVLSRLIYGTRAVLTVALGAVAIAVAIGVPLGLLFGYKGGWWDGLGMRVVDMLQSLPGLLIGLTVVTILGRNIFVLMFAIGLIFSMAFARLTRAIVMVERTKLYVEAAEVAGLTPRQIMFGQVLPNLIGPLITQAMVYFGSAVMIESAMSFLGIGLHPDTASWGSMLSVAVENQNAAPYLSWPPGVAIMLAVLAFNIFGDSFNDALTGRRSQKRKRRMPSPVALPQPKGATRQEATDQSSTSILEAHQVTVGLSSSGKPSKPIIEDVALTVGRGEIVGLLGESGSGKSTFARAVLGMLPPGTYLDNGSINIDGHEIAGLPERKLYSIRGTKIGAVFQDPMLSLSPVHTIGSQLIEPLRLHKKMNRRQAKKRAIELLHRVGVRDPEARFDDYLHQFSGGMAQRIAIALALAAEPELLIADEATSALDVTTQKQVLDLIMDLRDEFGMGVLMITHNLGVVAEACDRAAVMYKGKLVECDDVSGLFEYPTHPYTKALLASNPVNAPVTGRLPTIDKEIRAEIEATLNAS